MTNIELTYRIDYMGINQAKNKCKETVLIVKVILIINVSTSLSSSLPVVHFFPIQHLL